MSILDRFRKKQEKERIQALGAKAKLPAKNENRLPAQQPAPSAGKKVASGGKKKPELPTTAHAVLVRPLVTEKATLVGKHHHYVFAVQPKATKPQIRQAIWEVYGVQPRAIRVLRKPGKRVRFGRTTGRTAAWKKAVVILQAGQSIHEAETVA